MNTSDKENVSYSLSGIYICYIAVSCVKSTHGIENTLKKGMNANQNWITWTATPKQQQQKIHMPVRKRTCLAVFSLMALSVKALEEYLIPQLEWHYREEC